MHVIGHQHIGVQCAVGRNQRRPQPVHVAVVILVRKEAGLAVVTALHDVQRQAVEVGARATGRAWNLTPAEA
jgi:hypothetical protein